MRETRSRQPFYFMAVFWGATYREYFTDLLVASLLAPNNLPALDPRRRSRFLIVTTAEDWAALQQARAFHLLKAHVEPVWIEMQPPDPDDPKMLVMSAGHKAMAARAFEDRAYGVFVTPDLILSDGSVANMERLAEAGRKVVLSVAIRFAQETMLAEMEEHGYLKPGQPLAIGSRDLMRIALRNLHSETRRYEFDAPWFAESPISVYWRVPRADGMIIHSFSWAPLLVDYAALRAHDTATFEKWTLDGDYIYRNFPDPGDVYVVTDSDEIALVSFTKEADLHFDLVPYLTSRLRWVNTCQKLQLIRELRDSPVMDPLKRNIFPTPVHLHGDDISERWGATRARVASLMRRLSRTPTVADRVRMTIATMLIVRPYARPAMSFRWQFACWLWHYRRFAWQRVKEKAGLVPGRSRLDDGRDWLTPTLSLMNPIWSTRAILSQPVYRAAVRGRIAAWPVMRPVRDAVRGWRRVWRRRRSPLSPADEPVSQQPRAVGSAEVDGPSR